jgi:hypothetical protein
MVARPCRHAGGLPDPPDLSLLARRRRSRTGAQAQAWPTATPGSPFDLPSPSGARRPCSATIDATKWRTTPRWLHATGEAPGLGVFIREIASITSSSAANNFYQRQQQRVWICFRYASPIPLHHYNLVLVELVTLWKARE